MGGRSRPAPNIIPTHNRLYASIALESCIHSSAYIEKHYLGYFDFLAQVISFRKAINHVTSKSVHVLRVWDGYVARNERQNYKASWTVDLGQESLIVPPAPKFRNIPENYYYDVILYGNWIQHAVSLKSGDTVILKNLHFFLRKGNRCSALVLHEGNAFGRDIIKIEPELFNRHYRCVKLKNDLCDVLDEHYKRECTNEECTPRGQFHIHKNVEVATLNEQDKGSLTLSLEEGICPRSLDVAENLCKGCDRDARLTDNVTKSKLISQYGDEDCTSPDHSQHNVGHIAVTTDQDSASIVLSPEKEISPRRFAALAEIFYKRRDVDVQPTYVHS
ncbi:hypothetical protein OESDEN_06589 [Oesophagostomum dentatum]|uniref:Protection of telomeres protein 1 ssDNA-binding domain-containing protein n=1 Tax=Oesophagostomum dentatum TaxID=61180 RepID=A0A0B1TCD0_OESDE|nr:hypothetical protein OESDEN_06589 [Oesophagostomum dentatum]